MRKIPTDDQIKFDYIMSSGSVDDVRQRGEDFDRWLKQHDYELLAYHGMYADWMDSYTPEPTA